MATGEGWGRDILERGGEGEIGKEGGGIDWKRRGEGEIGKGGGGVDWKRG